MDPDQVKLYDLMKKYAIADIEGYDVKKISMNEWQEFEDEDDNAYAGKPFSYAKMLEGVMEHLEKTGGVEFAVLKDPELGRWWNKKVKQRERQRIFTEARAKLHETFTKEELKILGIKI